MEGRVGWSRVGDNSEEGWVGWSNKQGTVGYDKVE